MEPVDLQSVDPWSPVDPRSPGSAEPRLRRAQDLWSPGSAEPSICGARAILAPTGMAAYHINGNTIHSMILANEHRSLGPIFIPGMIILPGTIMV